MGQIKLPFLRYNEKTMSKIQCPLASVCLVEFCDALPEARPFSDVNQK